MAQNVYLTKSGFAKLEAELAELRGPKRQLISEAIREARGHGDLKENAAYHEAKLNQSRLEGRIVALEKVLEIAQIIERPDVEDGIAHLGSRVTLHDLKWDDQMSVTLVGPFEADPDQEMISIDSPLGAALIGKTTGDEVEVEAPAGVLRYKVVAIED